MQNIKQELIKLLEEMGYDSIHFCYQTEDANRTPLYYFEGEADDLYEIKIRLLSPEKVEVLDRRWDEKHFIRQETVVKIRQKWAV